MNLSKFGAQHSNGGRVQPQSRSKYRFSIWALASLFVVLAAWGANQPLPQPQLPSQPSESVQAADQILALPGLTTAQTVNGDIAGKYCTAAEDAAGCTSGKKESTELLPAWRWRTSTQLYSNLSAMEMGQSIMSTIASFFFATAQFVWSILLWVMKIALQLNMADRASNAINSGFSAIGRNMGTASPIVMVIVLVGLVAAGKALFSGHLPRAIGIALMVILPVAAIQSMTLISSGATHTPDNTLAPTGSAGWVAQRGVGLINTMGSSMATGIRGISGTNNEPAGFADSVANKDVIPRCSAYVAVLYDQYNSLNSSATTSRSTAGSFGAADPHVAVRDQISAMSWLWERSFLSGYVQAQFNSIEYGERMYCHRMDAKASVSPSEQQTLATLAYPDIKPTPSLELFNEPGEKKDQESQMFGWEACDWTGGKFEMNQAWLGITNVSKEKSTEICTDEWWVQGSSDAMEWSTREDLYSGYTHNLVLVGDDVDQGAVDACFAAINEIRQDGDLTPTEREREYQDLWEEGAGDCGADKVKRSDTVTQDRINARDTIDGYWGHNTGSRLFGSLLALLTALAYGYALGALAVGSIIAQFGLVLMLIVLPGTLLMLAFPGRKSGNPSAVNVAGKKMLRMTGGFFVAQLAFLLVILLLVQFIFVLESLIGGSGGSMWSMIIPLAALFLIRKILKSAGLGDIASPSGALGLTTAAAVGADGRAKMDNAKSNRARNRANRDQKAGIKPGMSRREKFAARARASKAGMLAAGAKKKGKWLANSSLGQRYALGQRWAQAFGDKETGQLGLAQQMRTLAGLNALAKGANPNSPLGKLAGLASRGLDRVPRGSWTKDKIGQLAMRNNQKAKMAELATRQRAERRAEIAATKGKSREERAAIRSELAEQRHDQGRARFQALTDEDGNAILTPDGNAVYGYRTPEGRRFAVDSSGQAVDSSGGAVSMQGLIPLTSPVEYFHDDDMRSIGIEFMEANGLRGNGDFVVSRWGEAPEIVPHLANAAGAARTPTAKTESHALKLAKNTGTWALAEHQKALPPELSDGAKAYAIARFEEAMGARDPETGATVDLAKEHGIDLDTEVGRAEWRKEQMGLPSAFDQIKVEIPADRYAAILSAASALDSKQGPRQELIVEARKERGEKTRAMGDAARQDVTRLQSSVSEMASIKTRYISAATKAEPIRVKLDTAHSETQAAQTRYESTLSSFSSPQEAEQLIEMVISTPHDELQMDGPTYTQSVQAAGVLQEFMAASSQEAELADMANEIEEAMRQAQSDMIAQAEASVNDIIVGTKDAEALKCSFELMLSDKNKMDTSKIIDAAEHFDTKEYPRFASELKAEVEAAVAEVQEATLAADTIRQRQASSNLESVIKRRKAQVISSLNERASKFPSMMQELEMEEMRLEESLRAATDLGKRRSNTYAAAGSPFPD